MLLIMTHSNRLLPNSRVLRHRIDSTSMSLNTAHSYFEGNKETILKNYCTEIQRPTNHIRFWNLFKINDTGPIKINRNLIMILINTITKTELINDSFAENPTRSKKRKLDCINNLKETLIHSYKLLSVIPDVLYQSKVLGIENEIMRADYHQRLPENKDLRKIDDDRASTDPLETKTGTAFIKMNDMRWISQNQKNKSKPRGSSYRPSGEGSNKLPTLNDIVPKPIPFDIDYINDLVHEFDELMQNSLKKKSKLEIQLFYRQVMTLQFSSKIQNLMFKDQEDYMITRYYHEQLVPIMSLINFATKDKTEENRFPFRHLSVYSTTHERIPVNDPESTSRLPMDPDITIHSLDQSNLDHNVMQIKIKRPRLFRPRLEESKDDPSIFEFINSSKLFHKLFQQSIEELLMTQSCFGIISDIEYSFIYELCDLELEKVLQRGSDDNEKTQKLKYNLPVRAVLTKNRYFKSNKVDELALMNINMLEERLLVAIFLLREFYDNNDEGKRDDKLEFFERLKMRTNYKVTRKPKGNDGSDAKDTSGDTDNKAADKALNESTVGNQNTFHTNFDIYPTSMKPTKLPISKLTTLKKSHETETKLFSTCSLKDFVANCSGHAGSQNLYTENLREDSKLFLKIYKRPDLAIREEEYYYGTDEQIKEQIHEYEMKKDGYAEFMKYSFENECRARDYLRHHNKSSTEEQVIRTPALVAAGNVEQVLKNIDAEGSPFHGKYHHCPFFAFEYQADLKEMTTTEDINNAYNLIHQLHNIGVAHGDLSLQNLMVSDCNDKVILCDFESAYFLDDYEAEDKRAVLKSRDLIDLDDIKFYGLGLR